MQNILILFILLIANIVTFAQQPLKLQLEQRGEIVITFDSQYLKLIPNINSWSVDKVENNTVYVYLNSDQYNKILELNIPFVPEPAPSLINKVKMAGSVDNAQEWDAFPDYETYIAMMEQFTKDYPDICKLDTIGFSTENRLLLALKISDNVAVDETEPEFFYTSSMHGDELTGYVLILRLADYILTNYSNAGIKDMVDNMEIYVNPLANPDGTFASGNSTVNGATRFNANGIDLNRNFPDPKKGDHPDGYSWQLETVAMMEFMKNRNFSLSMNFHGGAEVMNYPWDHIYDRHPDNDWWIFVCRNYADTVHSIDPFYLTDLQNGITHGADWYRVDGGRQDYVTHFLHGREVTAEISSVKLVNASELPAFWDKNYRSLLQFIQQGLYGIHGLITDTAGNAVQAKINIVGHDIDSSFVRTQTGGVFYRYLKEGTYDIKVSANGYISQTITNVVVKDFEATKLEIELKKGVSVYSQPLIVFNIFPNPANEQITITGKELNNSISKISIYNLSGKKVWEKSGIQLDNSIELDLKFLTAGVYVLSLQNQNTITTQKLIIR